MDVEQKRWQRNFDALNKHAQSKSPYEYSAIQREHVRDEMQQMAKDCDVLAGT